VTDRPVRSAAVEINPGEDGYVLYDPDHDRVHFVNHTAALVLELCDGQHTIVEVAAALEEVYPAAGPLAGHVARCVDGLRAEGIVLPVAVTSDAR
jgi:Coenzyme PQQ synthesis protein D (PqqD)